MRKHSRSSKHGGFKEVFLNPNDKGSGNHAQGANRGRTVLNLSCKIGSYECSIGLFRLEKIFLGILSVIGGPKGTVSKNLKKIFEPEGHFRTFFRKKFLSTITSGKFYVDPENLNPLWSKRHFERE